MRMQQFAFLNVISVAISGRLGVEARYRLVIPPGNDEVPLELRVLGTGREHVRRVQVIAVRYQNDRGPCALLRPPPSCRLKRSSKNSIQRTHNSCPDIGSRLLVHLHQVFDSFGDDAFCRIDERDLLLPVLEKPHHRQVLGHENERTVCSPG